MSDNAQPLVQSASPAAPAPAHRPVNRKTATFGLAAVLLVLVACFTVLIAQSAQGQSPAAPATPAVAR